GCEVGVEAWQRGDRGDHQLHQYFESIGAGGCWAPGEEGGREGIVDSALGEDFARTGIESRSRLSRRGRPDALSRKAEVSSGWLRVHHVHWELRTSTGRGVAGYRRKRSCGGIGAFREPKF